jgi:ZIP family zinc transporter
LEAFLWGLVVGAGLLVGALASYFFKFSHRLIAAIMGFGGGVLIAVIAFELTEKSYSHGGFISSVGGFLTGAVIFSSANLLLAILGAKHRKRCSECLTDFPEDNRGGDGLAIAFGSVMDSIPEAIIVGISLAYGVGISKAVLIGFFLANIPEGLASVSAMKKFGFSRLYIFGLWGGITILTGIAGMLGYLFFGGFTDTTNAFIAALAAGGILSMVSETMIPEAFEGAQSYIGLITSTGFLILFLLVKTGW